VGFSITISTISSTKSSEHFKNHHPKLQKIIHKNPQQRLSQNNLTMIKHQPQNKTQQTTTTINEKFQQQRHKRQALLGAATTPYAGKPA